MSAEVGCVPEEAALSPLPPLRTAALFAPLGEQLLELLRGLAPGDWELPTVCAGWRVREVAAHLLDTGLRRLSFGRDRHPPPAPAAPITGYRELVRFLDEQNATWIEATRRLSPPLLIELLEVVEADLPGYLIGVDHDGSALFPVTWAGEESSASWFDVARELSERWLHQQQIRRAVGAGPLDGAPLWPAVLETLLRAVAHRYRQVDAPSGSTVSLTIEARSATVHTCLRIATGWEMRRGRPVKPTCAVTVGFETAWRMLSKGIDPSEARRAATVGGDAALAVPLFDTVAVMA